MKINADQLALLNSYSSNSYVSELVKHCKSIFPLIYDSLHEKTLTTNIAKLIETAGRTKVTQRGPLQLYFDMAITLGSDFETDPMYTDFSFEPEQYPTKNQLEISLSLHDKFSIYIENVIGEDGKYAKNFLGRLEVEMFSNIHRINFIESMHKLLIDVYPQKYDFLGLDKINALIELGTKKFKHDNTRPKIQAIYIMLMFVIGHGFEND
ncbi:hypothetical protein UXO11_22835 [Enterobacter wuhouensis]|uniref:hypothetical protein n=1 Tax=Enterobacter wuhouensis TaxID=2529381 RepID=UPI002FCFD419